MVQTNVGNFVKHAVLPKKAWHVHAHFSIRNSPILLSFCILRPYYTISPFHGPVRFFILLVRSP